MVIENPPTTPAELYDYLRGTFGIGNYDEMFGEPWYKARIAEIGKLKSAMRRRRLSVGDVYDAAEHARAAGLPITETWQVLDLVSEARLEAAKRRRSERFRTVQHDLEDALSQAHAAGRDDWVARLLGADSREVAQVIQDWRGQCTS